jgi:S1-C subfamily serine protease
MTTYYVPADSMTTTPVPPGPPGFPAGPPPAPPVPPVPSGRRPRGRRGAIALTAAVAVVVGAAVGAGIGHVAWSNAPVFEAAPAPSTTPDAGVGGVAGGNNGPGSGNDGLGGNPGGQSIFPPFLIPLLPGEGSGGSGGGSGNNGLGGINGGPGGSGNSGGLGNPGGLGNSGGSGGLGGFGGQAQQPGAITSAPGAPGDVGAIAAKVDPAVVDINDLFGYQQAAGAGTGIVLTADGLVLSNNHVIDGATAIQATDQGNGKTYTATVVGYDPTSDVALLRLKGASHLATATLGDSSTVTVGEPVVGIGNAEGVGGTPSAAGGSVTALDKTVSVGDDMYGTVTTLKGLIQVNSDILPGDSGGPLVDSKGAVVGIDTAAAAGQATASSGFEGEAIPINRAEAIVATIESGHGTGSVHVGPTAALGLLMQGTDVGGVVTGGAAATAGLQAGDRITSVGGHHVSSGQDLQHVMLGYHPGQSVTVGWVDPSGAAHAAAVTLRSGPAA